MYDLRSRKRGKGVNEDNIKGEIILALVKESIHNHLGRKYLIKHAQEKSLREIQ
jgi:hypothetical protein